MLEGAGKLQKKPPSGTFAKPDSQNICGTAVTRALADSPVLGAGPRCPAVGLCEERPRPVPVDSSGLLTGRSPWCPAQDGAWQ